VLYWTEFQSWVRKAKFTRHISSIKTNYFKQAELGNSRLIDSGTFYSMKSNSLIKPFREDTVRHTTCTGDRYISHNSQMDNLFSTWFSWSHSSPVYINTFGKVVPELFSDSPSFHIFRTNTKYVLTNYKRCQNMKVNQNFKNTLKKCWW